MENRIIHHKTTVAVTTNMTKKEMISFISFDNKLVGSFEAMNLPELFHQVDDGRAYHETVFEIHDQTEKLDMQEKTANCPRKIMANSECLATACAMLQYHHQNPNKHLLVENGKNVLLTTRLRGLFGQHDSIHVILNKLENGRWEIGCENHYQEERLNESFWFPIGSRLFFSTSRVS
jgi:ferredoxin